MPCIPSLCCHFDSFFRFSRSFRHFRCYDVPKSKYFVTLPYTFIDLLLHPPPPHPPLLHATFSPFSAALNVLHSLVFCFCIYFDERWDRNWHIHYVLFQFSSLSMGIFFLISYFRLGFRVLNPMLPWVPFFVFSQQPPSRRSKQQSNLLEQMLEVKAIGVNVEKLHNGPSYEMMFHLTTSNRSKSTPLLVKAPTQNEKREIEVETDGETNISTKYGEREEDEFVSLKNRCHTIASTSACSVPRGTKVQQNGDVGHHSPTPSAKHEQSSSSSPVEMCDNSLATAKPFRRRTAFETSEAMREIFGAYSPFSVQQKESLGESNRRKMTVENGKTTNGNQQNGKSAIRPSEMEDDIENRDFENMSMSVSEASSEVGSASIQDGTTQSRNERPFFENGVTKRNVRLKSDIRISPASSGSWERTSRPAGNNHQNANLSSVGRRPAAKANPNRAAVCWYCGVKGHAAAHCQKKRRKGQ